MVSKVDIRQLVRERLRDFPEVPLVDGPDWIKVLPADSFGFEVGVYLSPLGHTVYFEGWHEELTSEKDALDCVMFGLSQSCRLAIAMRGNYPSMWTVETFEGDTWVPLSKAGRFLQPFWRRATIEYRSNRLFDLRTRDEVTRFRQLVDKGYAPQPQ